MYDGNSILSSNELVQLLPLPQGLRDNVLAYEQLLTWLWDMQDYRVAESDVHPLYGPGVRMEAYYYPDTINGIIFRFSEALKKENTP